MSSRPRSASSSSPSGPDLAPSSALSTRTGGHQIKIPSRVAVTDRVDGGIAVGKGMRHQCGVPRPAAVNKGSHSVRLAVSIGVLGMLLVGTPASAITAQQKMETCKFGADDQKLTGAERKSFLSKCMANEKASSVKPKPQPQ